MPVSRGHARHAALSRRPPLCIAGAGDAASPSGTTTLSPSPLLPSPLRSDSPARHMGHMGGLAAGHHGQSVNGRLAVSGGGAAGGGGGGEGEAAGGGASGEREAVTPFFAQPDCPSTTTAGCERVPFLRARVPYPVPHDSPREHGQ
jgi:hypothetical protein